MEEEVAVGVSNELQRPLSYRALFDGLPDASVLIDAAGVIRWGNAAAARRLGRPMAEWLGRSGLELIHPDDLQLALNSLSTAPDKEAGTTIEVRVRTADGWRLAEVLGASVAETAGMIMLTFRDVTERRQWEVASDDTARLRALVHHAPSLMALLGPDGTVRASSGAITRLLGHDQEQLAGRSLADLVMASDRHALAGAIHRAGDASVSAEPVRVEVHMRDERHQRHVLYELSILGLLDDPTIRGFIVTGHDVSDRRAAEEDLRDTLSLLNATLDSTADGILVVDLDGRVTGFNARFIDMWQVPSHVLAPGDDDLLLAFVKRQLRDPEEFVATVHQRYADRESDGYDLLAFADGRVYERYSTPQRVGGEVVGRVWSFHDITRQKQLEAELEHQAFHDSLTGLANQALFRERLAETVARAGRDGTGLALLYFDLDDFKRVNDSLGHTAGDHLLVAVSDRLRTCVRACDTAARLGGDEFAVLVESCPTQDTATDIASRIIDAFRHPFHVDGRELVASVSLGIAFGNPRISAEQLLTNADLAMYTAKGRGRNRFELFASGMHSEAVARLETEAELRGALDRGEFELAYQPIVETSTGRVAGLEALVRWAHPDRGMIGPEQFIVAAEDIGVINQLGQLVLDRACLQFSDWLAAGADPELTIAVNVSPRQLVNNEIIDQVQRALELSGLDPRHLVLEITESAMLHDTRTATHTLGELRDIGVTLALDDFGTGFSSLTHLQQFPIDVIKIDRSFTGTAAATRRLLLAIVRLSQELGMVAVAEGVESAEQVEVLVQAGCERAQGYYFALPTAADDLDATLLGETVRQP
ncbi:MAG: EAL domain-containing protein [Acidimicrobiales bacterium]|nr:EAL domain-containing protein [Acidimicrobiales bacterium]